MKSYKFLQFCFFLLLFSLPNFNISYAQQSRSNHEKYWYYRDRLRDKFIRIGEEEGESLPAGIRYVEYHEGFGEIKALGFGDGTIYLGWYIGVLATELYLLRESNQDYSEATRELYYALLAFDRLDMNSEILWSNWNEVVPNGNNSVLISEAPWDPVTNNWVGTSQPLNGFFCRNDAPPYFETKFPNGEYQFIKGGVSNRWNPAISDPNLLIFPPYYYRNVGYANGGSEASQDQIFNLLMGFLLVNEFVGVNQVSYNGVDLGSKAKSQALRIIDHYNAAAQFRNPGRTEPCGNSSGCLPFNGGGESFIFAYPLAIYANYIDNGVPYLGWPAQDFYDELGLNPYWNKWKPACNAGKTAWRAWSFVTSDDPVNNSMRMMMAAITNSYDDIGDGPLKLYTWGTSSDIGWEFYYLLNKALYPNNTEYWDGYDVRDELELCPCEGPHNLNGDNTSSYPWNLSNRYYFDYKDTVHWPDESMFGMWGEFNALDYMLLYNLFAIVYDNYNGASYTDHIERKLMSNSIFPNGTYASTTNPEVIVGFNTIETNLVVNGAIGSSSAGDITLKAGEQIFLKPGFKANDGCNFKATISENFDCNSNGFYKNLNTNNELGVDNVSHVGKSYSDRTEKFDANIEMQRFLLETKANYAELMQSRDLDVLQHQSDIFIVGPNPIRDIVVVNFEEKNLLIQSFLIIDGAGKLIHKAETYFPNTQIDISGLASGIYYINVKYRDKYDKIGEQTIPFIKTM